MCHSIGPFVCCVSVCLFVCLFVCLIDIKSVYSKRLNFVSDPVNTQEGPSGTKLPRCDMFRSIMLLSKLTHQMWHHNPFSQRNKATKREGGVFLASGQNLKKAGYAK